MTNSVRSEEVFGQAFRPEIDGHHRMHAVVAAAFPATHYLTPTMQHAGTAMEPFMEADPDKNPALWERAGAARLKRLFGLQQLRGLRADLTRDHVLHLRGMQLDVAVPLTPYEGDADLSSPCIALANLFGTIGMLELLSFSYQCENGGRIVRHVCPRLAAAREVSSQGWAKELSWHIDAAYRPIGDDGNGAMSPAPRWLCWSVIHDWPAIPVTLVRLIDLIPKLTPATIEQLAQPQFMVGAPDSFMDRGEACSVPVLVPDGCGGFYSRYNQGLTRGTNPAACAALDEMARALDDGTVVHRLDIEAGDIVILDNWRTLHMRPDFEPRWDGYDRWLLRVYAAERVMRGVSISKDWPRCWR